MEVFSIMTNYGYTGWQNKSGYKRKIRERDNYTCQLCGRPGYDVDHIVPMYVGKGGQHCSRVGEGVASESEKGITRRYARGF